MRSGEALGGSTRGKPSPAGSLLTEATPALVVDRDVLIANVAAMAARARTAGVTLWPHAKTHKTAQIAALQREHGAAGITVATLAEAEYFAAEGFDEILLAYPPVGDWRLARLTELARRARLRVVLDDAGVLAGLIEACRPAGVVIGYLWEVDCGTGRLGTAPGEPTATAVAAAPRAPECPFEGLMTFGGHAYAAADDAELDRAAADERRALEASAEALRNAGIDCPVRSAGTTPTAHRLRAGTGITEMRPGNYVFYDATQVALGLIEPPGCALTVLATVIGRPGPRRVILDAGSKALSAERLTPRAPGFGLVLGHPELTVERLYEQHAIVDAPQPTGLRVGERVRIVPNHACTTANLHRRALVAQGEDVVDVWSIGAAGPGG
ncbi:MAG TPA: alanine racemase [Solirubrobacteraceae bacterium]|jgi:D-serine deaminase-like pyridoxal phosphate-dependent protein|nr:alanine racemase [Solirubrobacteraceae bacterium]